MNRILLAKLDTLDHDLEKLFTHVEHANENMLHHKKTEHAWSIAQILEHMRVSEKQIYNGIKKSLETRKSFRFATFSSDLILWCLILLFKLKIKIKAPTFVSNLPERPDLAYVRSDWKNTRTEMRKLIATLPNSMVNKIVFKHPLIGLLSFKQVLLFEYNHFLRHKDQIEKIMNLQAAK